MRNSYMYIGIADDCQPQGISDKYNIQGMISFRCNIFR